MFLSLTLMQTTITFMVTGPKGIHHVYLERYKAWKWGCLLQPEGNPHTRQTHIAIFLALWSSKSLVIFPRPPYKFAGGFYSVFTLFSRSLNVIRGKKSAQQLRFIHKRLSAFSFNLSVFKGYITEHYFSRRTITGIGVSSSSSLSCISQTKYIFRHLSWRLRN